MSKNIVISKNINALHIGRLLKLSFVLLVLLVLMEIGSRYFGLIDFPIFDSNNRIGYVVKPNQNGTFLNRNDWEFNSLGMGAKEFLPGPDNVNVLLVGDSVVYGGNPISKRIG